jgi:hypothetical protein
MDYYRLLGLDNNATEEDIKCAYRTLAKRYHPDLNQDKNAEYLFLQIKQAYDVLNDFQKRRDYDKQMGLKHADNKDTKEHSAHADDDQETIELDDGFYTGQLRNGKPHGLGKMVWSNGDSYQGNFLDNEFYGQGIYTWNDGDKYDGEWEKGNRNGYGIMYHADGNIEKGEWLNDEFISRLVTPKTPIAVYLIGGCFIIISLFSFLQALPLIITLSALMAFEAVAGIVVGTLVILIIGIVGIGLIRGIKYMHTVSVVLILILVIAILITAAVENEFMSAIPVLLFLAIILYGLQMGNVRAYYRQR